MRVGDREVVGNGSIVAKAGDETVEFSYGTLNVKVIFQKDGDKTKPGAVDYKVEGQNAVFTARNFDNSLGLAFDLEVGSIEGPPKKLLFLAVVVHAIGTEKPARLISYTFSQGEA